MDFLKDGRTRLALGGAIVALLAGLAIAWALVSQHRGEKTPPPPASQGGLVIESRGAPPSKVDAARTLRCFVAGQYVGDLALADCAKRNGVATDALDVGLDQTGALAAANQAGAMITPLPPQAAASPSPASEAPEPVQTPGAIPQTAAGPADVCWRYAAGQWRRITPDMPLTACAQALFAGRCERAGDAAYGRWAQQTLRLTPGHIDISSDNRSFRPLMDHPACQPLG
ncbi:hypothetical protein [Phenylobacterium sp.]|jgi:hypothetical protein|uniref:hypothetical protein n=1 Tax=Phenylobacterium sp. TaxID=1871053 RepID=UPI002F3E9B66